MDDVIVFGDALLNAVNKDTHGKPPCIVLTETVTEIVYKQLQYYADYTRSPHYSDLLQSPDGKIFLNYLNLVFELENYGKIFFDALEKHRNKIIDNLEIHTNTNDVQQKYIWLANYHNFVCRNFGHHFFTEDNQNINEEMIKAEERVKKIQSYQ